MPSTAKAPYAAYIQARSCGQREGFVYLSTHTEVGPWHGVPTPPVAEAELVGGGGARVAQVMLTWGATIVQSLANSTCPERAKRMTSRKEVNHITHSKSATSWGRPGQVTVGRGSESPHHPSPPSFLCTGGEPWLEGRTREVPAPGVEEGQREKCPAPRSSPSAA